MQDDAKDWLKTNFLNAKWEIIMERWRECSKLRLKDLTGYKDTKKIFQEWPILAIDNGYLSLGKYFDCGLLI